jgi:hypothetical protein
MKNILIFFALLVFFACNLSTNKNQNNQDTDSLNNKTIGIDDKVQDTEILCFEEKKLNISKADTTTIINNITLKIKDDYITGVFSETIDGRYSESYGGTIKGNKDKNILKVKFITDMGGSEESTEHEFRIEDEKLIEMPLKSADKNQKETSFIRVFNKIVCG